MVILFTDDCEWLIAVDSVKQLSKQLGSRQWNVKRETKSHFTTPRKR